MVLVPAAPRPRSHRLSPGPKNKCAPLSRQCRSCQGHLSKQHQAPRPRFSRPARLRAYRVKPRKPSRVAGENMRNERAEIANCYRRSVPVTTLALATNLLTALAVSIEISAHLR
jgi:hypothetical protein